MKNVFSGEQNTILQPSSFNVVIFNHKIKTKQQESSVNKSLTLQDHLHTDQNTTTNKQRAALHTVGES